MMPARAFSSRVSPHRLLAGLAAALLAAATPGAVRAQEVVAVPNGLGSSGLRTGAGLDPAASLRSDTRRDLVEPFSLKPSAGSGDASARPSSDAASSDDADEDASEDADAPTRRPKIDLFAEPANAGAARSNVAPGPAEPAGAFEDPFAPKAKAPRPNGKDARLRRRAGAPADTGRSPGSPLPPAGTPAPDGAAIDRGRVSLAAAPVRSSRTEPLDGRPVLRAAPLRGALPEAVDDPFSPIGLRLGSFLLYAALDQSAGYSTNLDRRANGADGAFSDTVLATRLVSDWSRHEAEVDALVNYRRNFGGDVPSDPDIAIDGRLRLDVDRLTTANLRGGLVYRQEDDTDLDATPENGSSDKPDILNYSTSADIERQFGEAFARGTVSAVRETKTSEGRLDALDENFNTYTGALRTGYRFSPAFAPFLEGSVGRRVFDRDAGPPALERDSTIEALRGGVAFDFGEKLNGEVAAGYAWNVPDAAAVATVASPTLDAKVNWSPRRGTDIALTATTTFDPDASSSATSTLYQVGLAARHRATARLDLNAALLAGYRDSQLATDTEWTWGASAGFAYWMNRSLAFIGLATHEDIDRLHSPGDYTVDTVKLGIRLQN